MYPLHLPRIWPSRGYRPICGRFPKTERTIRLDPKDLAAGEQRLAEELAQVLPVFDDYPDLNTLVDKLADFESTGLQYLRSYALIGLGRMDEGRALMRELIESKGEEPAPGSGSIRDSLNQFCELADDALADAVRVARDDNIRNLKLRKLLPKEKQPRRKTARKRRVKRDLSLPMNYQEFKTHYLKILDGMMAELGLGRKRGTTPTYWHCPHEDQRLTWVVCFNFSMRGNPFFGILLGPYWRGHDLESGDPFPGGVGYRQSLNPNGVGASHHWNATDTEIRASVEALRCHGLPFLQRFDTPEKLLQAEPSGIMAYDLGRFDEAVPLLRASLQQLYENDYDKGGESPAGLRMHKERLARAERYMEDTLKQLGLEASGIPEACRLKAAEAVRKEFTELVAAQPRARWAKNVLRAAEEDIAALSKKSATTN